MMKNRVLAMLCAAVLLVIEVGCGASFTASDATPEAASDAAPEAEETSATAEISLAYQYGLAYAPAVIASQKGLIEEAYKEATGQTLTVKWNQMNSGADINTGIAAGEIDAGFMGVAPALTGIMKGVGYRIFTNLSGQRHGLMSNDPEVSSLADLVGTEKQIALVNTGSIQHILLGKALSENGFDAHALDSNIVAMAHPDGMTALESGNVSCHLTSSPYIFMELADSKYTELPEVEATWSSEDSFIVGVASEELKEKDPAAYEALCAGIQKAMDLIVSEPDTAAEMLYELDKNTVEEELEYLKQGTYTSKTSGIYELAQFMYDNKFLEKLPDDYSSLVFENVTGD